MSMNPKIIPVFLLTAIATASILMAQPKRDNPEPFFRGSDKKDKNEEANLRTLQGVVKDEADNFVEGAVVQLRNKKTDQIRSFITLQDGIYKFNGLSPNIDYELKAASNGRVSGIKVVSVFDARKKMIINLKLGKKESK